MRKLVLFFAIIVFLSGLALAVENPAEVENSLITDFGVIIRGMPKENLVNAGFNKDKLISYDAVENQEYITFLDITLVGNNITFYLEDGKVKEWFRGFEVGTLEGGN